MWRVGTPAKEGSALMATPKQTVVRKAPKAKPRAPFRRWTVRTDSGFRGSLDFDDEQVGYLRMSRKENEIVVAALNRSRVVQGVVSPKLSW